MRRKYTNEEVRDRLEKLFEEAHDDLMRGFEREGPAARMSQLSPPRR